MSWLKLAPAPPLSIALLFGAVLPCEPSLAGDADLAQKLSNPISSLISVPIQYNSDRGFGPDEDGDRHLINVQPVVPVSLDADWNLISRTVVPIVVQHDLFPGAGSQSGLGDTVQSFFFSPKIPVNGITWGAGPVILLPTGTERLLTGDKWGAGPTAVALTQQNGWTIGVLANHIWSFAGDGNRADISATFIQPFLAYTTPDAWTFSLNSESTYDWINDQWSIPINLSVSKLTKFGTQPVSLGAGVRYWAESPDSGPEGFGARASITFLFPTGG